MRRLVTQISEWDTRSKCGNRYEKNVRRFLLAVAILKTMTAMCLPVRIHGIQLYQFRCNQNADGLIAHYYNYVDNLSKIMQKTDGNK